MSEAVESATLPASVPLLARRGVQLSLLVLAVTAGAYARTAVNPLQESVRRALSLTDNQIGLLQGPALALLMMLAAIPLGLLIDRRSRVRLLVVLTAFSVVGGLSSALAPNYAVLLAARCAVGFTAFAVNPVALSLIADLYAASQRGRAAMAMAIGQYAGVSAAFASGGGLLAALGSEPNDWRWAMLWLTAPIALVLFLILAMREPARTELAIRNPSVRASWGELWRYRAVIAPLLAGILMVEIGIGAALVWTAPTLARSFAVSPERIGAIMAMAFMTSGVLGPLIGGTLADFCHRTGGPRRTMSLLIGLTCLSAPAGIFAIAPGATSAGVLLVAFLTIITAMIVAGTTLFTVVIPGELRGLCMAMLAGACVVFGTGLAPMTVSLLAGALGGPAMIGRALALACLLSSLLAATALLRGRRYFSARRNAVEPAPCIS